MVTAPPFLAIEHLQKSYRSRAGVFRALDDLSFSVQTGEIFGLLGPNGAGKTTTLSILCGLLQPDGGRVLLEGAQLRRGDLRARVGVCPQRAVIWEKLTCLEQLTMTGELYNLARREARRRGEQLLKALGLAEKRDSLAQALSGGMQRRLNLALALVHDPDLLVLDEPEAGLDPQSRVLVREFIRAWRHERPGRTVLFTTHNMDEAERLVDRAAIIDHGRLLDLDTPEALIRRYGQGDVLEIPLKISPSAADVERIFPGALLRDGVLEIRCAGAVEALPGVLERLGQAQWTPAEVRLRENSLEDVFLALTGRRLRE
jgi:ABC-2 type transport system ATP-binding protein